MAVPSYNELLTRHDVQSSEMNDAVQNAQLTEISSILDRWERLARSLGLDNSDIESIIRERDTEEEKRDKMLQRWKQRRGSAATYEELTTALLRIKRTDLAERVISMRLSVAVSTLPASNKEVESNVLQSAQPPPSTMTPTGEQIAVSNTDIKQTLVELEEDFYQLVHHVEVTLVKHDVGLNEITRRFSMLPQSVKQRHETDKSYRDTKHKILNSTSIKAFINNLTDLKHWNFMMPDTLAHILKDVKIDDIHQKIDKYKEKLSNFKTQTKLRDLIGTDFQVPEYCTELIMEVKGWEDKTIGEAEKSVRNICCCSCGQNVHLGLKGVEPGSIKLMFILLEPMKITPGISLDTICRKYTGVMNIKLDSDNLYTDNNELKDEATGTNELVLERLWHRTGTTRFGVGGGRDVLIISADLPPHQPEAVARRPGQLTEEDKQKLLSQGVTSDCQSEVDIVRARYGLDKSCKIVDVMSEHSLAQDVSKSIKNLLNTTKNDGVTIHYIGAGRRNTGDWCFKDGFITFRDIAQLYLQSKLRGRVLSIVSDCSYSGRWVRDCMEFLDEQGVQPCGHKAREKGIIIKVYASCKPNQIPTEYRYSVSGADSDKNTGVMGHYLSKQLLETQITYGINSSHISCSNKTITEPCTLKPGYTWRKKEEGRRVRLVRGKDHGRPVWHYVLVVDDEDTMHEFLEKIKSGQVDVADYGRVLHSGWGDDPPNDIRERLDEEYLW